MNIKNAASKFNTERLAVVAMAAPRIPYPEINQRLNKIFARAEG